MCVRSWMTLHPTAVTPDTTVLEARAIMLHGEFRHLPVVQAGWLAGMISDRDLVAPDTQLVRGVMSSPVCTAAPDDDLVAVARTMIAHGVHGMPVLDRDGFLIGMITTTDCLRALIQETPAEAESADAAASSAAG